MGNREIKFRAWNNETKELKEVSRIDFDEIKGTSVLVKIASYIGYREVKNGIQTHDLGTGMSTEYSRWTNFELCQFTGLKDKNGKEIYEVDILKNEDLGNDIKVDWSEKYASFVLNRKGWAYSLWFDESYKPSEVEIIGNIYENPELL